MKKEYCGMPMRIAHTGVTQFAPENTLEAFRKSAELGLEGIELDIQLCGDGEIIITHNGNMGYMTFEKHRDVLMDMTAEQIKKFDIPYRNALKLKYPADPCQVNGRIVMRPYPMKCHTLIFVPCYPQQNVECW